MIYIVTGHLGSGKSLLAVRIVHDYLKAGRRVASNLTLNMQELMPPRSQVTCTKLPYIPQATHLDQLGRGYEGKYDEKQFGVILLDEAGSWLNSRDWADKDRRDLFRWITHARKYGWDVILIIQDFEALDAQIRRSVTEVFVKCARLDRIKVPFLPIKLPRIHLAKGLYGGPQGMDFKKWWARGNDYFKAYDTQEAIRPEVEWLDDGTEIDMRANVTRLSAHHLLGRYMPPKSSAIHIAVTAFKWLAVLVLLPLMSVGRPFRVGLRTTAAIEYKLDRMVLFPGMYPEEIEWAAAQGLVVGSAAHKKLYRIRCLAELSGKEAKPVHKSKLVASGLFAYNAGRAYEARRALQ